MPLSGKTAFLRWRDKQAKKDLMKIEYVYRLTEQFRNDMLLILDVPP